MENRKQNFVEPLRTTEEIENMKNALLRHSGGRDYFLFVFGINTGLRVSDILPLKVGDIKGKTHLKIKEKKTSRKATENKKAKSKIRTVTMNEALIEEISEYTRYLNDDDYLFPSRIGNLPITTTQAYRTLRKSAEMADLKNVGTHTMRKTFGYHYYKKTMNILQLMKIFGHTNPAVTLVYISIEQEEIDESLRDFVL